MRRYKYLTVWWDELEAEVLHTQVPERTGRFLSIPERTALAGFDVICGEFCKVVRFDVRNG